MGVYHRISIHALLAESDRQSWQAACTLTGFLSTLSLRRATFRDHRAAQAHSNFYPRSPCGERQSRGPPAGIGPNFYPRSPCGERPFRPHAGKMGKRISIHALLAESDYADNLRHNTLLKFLSTLSLRRATLYRHRPDRTDPHFYPRSPCGERLTSFSLNSSQMDFYPRSPCGERPTTAPTRARRPDFYPRSPCGERHLHAGRNV